MPQVPYGSQMYGQPTYNMQYPGYGQAYYNPYTYGYNPYGQAFPQVGVVGWGVRGVVRDGECVVKAHTRGEGIVS
jgi:hypothetical protein